MNVIIVGCGRMGAQLAYQLYRSHHRVTLVDLNSSAFANLPPDFRGRTLEGDVLNQDVLERLGIAQADALVAVTNSDALNAVVCHLARSVYGVTRVVSRNYEPRWLALHHSFNVPVISSATWGAQRIEAMLTISPLHTIAQLGGGEMAIYEFEAPLLWMGRTLAQVLPAEATPLAVTRQGKALPATHDFVLQMHDTVHLSAAPVAAAELRTQLQKLQGV